MTALTPDFLTSFKRFIVQKSNLIFQAKKEPHEIIAEFIELKLYCDELQATLKTD